MRKESLRKYLKAACLLLAVTFVLNLGGCSTLDFPTKTELTRHIDDNDRRSTRIYKATTSTLKMDDDSSALFPLANGLDALGVRLLALERAEKSIDIQSFLMKDDASSYAIANGMLHAADRGVRVRFLLDDVFTTTTAKDLLLLDQHPNIEVRMFNPLSRTGSKWLNYLGDYHAANRRMHNKSFTVDNTLTIVGGRNLADEYFQLNQNSLFTDFDFLALGEIAQDVSVVFDDFWNHPRSLPIKTFLEADLKWDLNAARTFYRSALDDNNSRLYQQASQSQLFQQFLAGDMVPKTADVQVIADDPYTLFRPSTRKSQASDMAVTREFVRMIDQAQTEVFLISPYFIPGDAGMEVIRSARDRGVKITVVTNSLASNNHLTAHGSYAPYRTELLKAGVHLFEVRASATDQLPGGFTDSITLHTKIAFFDQKRVFAGSLNLDPRSYAINTEMGLLVNSAAITEKLQRDAENLLDNFTYRLELRDGQIQWTKNADQRAVIYTKDPDTHWLRRRLACLARIAPESQM